ncbi:hypothetical protein MPC1_6590001 [Methylocella tundrae]|nr:hypothetical protein MPC1_6590001 [Methylocella tundrae]
MSAPAAYILYLERPAAKSIEIFPTPAKVRDRRAPRRRRAPEENGRRYRKPICPRPVLCYSCTIE